MSAEVDALTVVNQLRDLAADPLNRRAIVEDHGCLPGLILFLDHPNPQVVYSALLVSIVCLFINQYVVTRQRTRRNGLKIRKKLNFFKTYSAIMEREEPISITILYNPTCGHMVAAQQHSSCTNHCTEVPPAV